MEFGVILKLMFFMLWPILLMLIYFIFSKKKFMEQWEKFKKGGFFAKD
jgi:hypothetical protein